MDWKMVHQMFFLSALSVAGAQVADFAPLEVGNTWKYRGTESTADQVKHTRKDVEKTLKVVSKTVNGAVTVYEISARDSLYGRWDSSSSSVVRNLPDSIIQRTESLIESGDTLTSSLAQFFHLRRIADSLKNREVTTRPTGSLIVMERLTGPFPIEGEPRWVYIWKTHHLIGMGAASSDSSIFVQNLGAVVIEGGGGKSGISTSHRRYRLFEFNGDPVEYTHQEGASIRSKSRNSTRLGAMVSGPVPLFQGNRDGLGRRR